MVKKSAPPPRENAGYAYAFNASHTWEHQWIACCCWQIFLLVAQPSYLVTALFRLHMHFVYGATIAVLLPVVNTRLVSYQFSSFYWPVLVRNGNEFVLVVCPCIKNEAHLSDCQYHWLCEWPTEHLFAGHSSISALQVLHDRTLQIDILLTHLHLLFSIFSVIFR